MSKEIGALKYFAGVLLTATGIFSMYIFGDGIINTIDHFDAVIAARTAKTTEDLIPGLIDVYVPLPGEILGPLVVYPVIGCRVATFFWYVAVK